MDPSPAVDTFVPVVASTTSVSDFPATPRGEVLLLVNPLLMLKCLELVLCRYPTAADFEHSTHRIADFLGPSSTLSLRDACTFGAIPLLDWIWHSSCTSSSDRPSRWSLCNCLRSDPHYYRWQFAASLEVAAGRGDLDTLTWLVGHFSGCEVSVNVVEVAAQNGHLHVLQHLLAHDSGRHDGEENPIPDEGIACGGVPGRVQSWGVVVEWGHDDMVKAVENGHFEVAKWLYEHTARANDDRDLEAVTALAISVGDMELAELLIPRGGSILDYAYDSPCSDTIEWMLNCGHLNQNVDRAVSAMLNLACGGYLALLQRIVRLYTPPPWNDPRWLDGWYDAMRAACKRGDLPMLRWLTEFQSEWSMRQTHEINYLLDMAAEEGHVDIMLYLHEHGGIDRRGDGILNAARKGHLESVRWLVNHFPYSNQQLVWVIGNAALHGHLKILEFFYSLESTKTAQIKRKSTEAVSRTQLAVDSAAKGGHLSILKWLRCNRYEGCTKNTIDYAVLNGHLDVVEWLLMNTRTGCTKNTMVLAAEHGHLTILKWLHLNRSEEVRVRALALKKALSNGHIHVASWLLKHFPKFAPSLVLVTPHTHNIFELLLFLHGHFAKLLTPTLVENVRQILGKTSMAEKWMLQNYPSR